MKTGGVRGVDSAAGASSGNVNMNYNATGANIGNGGFGNANRSGTIQTEIIYYTMN